MNLREKYNQDESDLSYELWLENMVIDLSSELEENVSFLLKISNFLVEFDVKIQALVNTNIKEYS